MERSKAITWISVAMLLGALVIGCDNSLGSSQLFQYRQVRKMFKGPHLFLAPNGGFSNVLNTNALRIVRQSDKWPELVALLKSTTNRPTQKRLAGLELTTVEIPEGTLGVDVHPSQLTEVIPDEWTFYLFPRDPNFRTFFKPTAAQEISNLCAQHNIGYIHLLTPGPNLDFDLQGTAIHYLRIHHSKSNPAVSDEWY